jgi:FAD/FMN-containing dehydrogenase
LRSNNPSHLKHSVRQQSLLIDLKGLRELSFDPDANIATVSPSITGGELNPYLAKFGRFFAGGHCPTVGLGGFLLQG